MVTNNFKPKNITDAEWLSIKAWIKPIKWVDLDIYSALQHVKFRDLTVLRKNGIGGCHDALEFEKIRQVREIGFTMPIDKTLDEVPEIIISSLTNHPTVSGVKIVTYKIPTVNAQLKTTGIKGASASEDFIKSIYDPVIWSDAKLEKALKEALQDAANGNKGIIPTKFKGNSIEGYPIEGYFRNGKIETFYFL